MKTKILTSAISNCVVIVNVLPRHLGKHLSIFETSNLKCTSFFDFQKTGTNSVKIELELSHRLSAFIFSRRAYWEWYKHVLTGAQNEGTRQFLKSPIFHTNTVDRTHLYDLCCRNNAGKKSHMHVNDLNRFPCCLIMSMKIFVAHFRYIKRVALLVSL